MNIEQMHCRKTRFKNIHLAIRVDYLNELLFMILQHFITIKITKYKQFIR